MATAFAEAPVLSFAGGVADSTRTTYDTAPIRHLTVTPFFLVWELVAIESCVPSSVLQLGFFPRPPVDCVLLLTLVLQVPDCDGLVGAGYYIQGWGHADVRYTWFVL